MMTRVKDRRVTPIVGERKVTVMRSLKLFQIMCLTSRSPSQNPVRRREQASLESLSQLSIGNYIFCRRKELKSGRVTFTCNQCETEGKFVSATAEVVDGQYHLVDAPDPEEHSCWASGTAVLLKQARSMMYKKVEEDPTRPILEIHEEVKNLFTEGMDQTTMQSFLQEFPTWSSIQSRLYKRRREKNPPNPESMKDVDVTHSWFYNRHENIVKGDALLDDGRRVILMSTNDHLDLMARSPQLLGDGTFRITPALWLQVFIISAQIFGSVFVPVCFCLLPDKKRETYDLMFSMMKEALAGRGLELSAEHFMSDLEVAIRDSFT